MSTILFPIFFFLPQMPINLLQAFISFFFLFTPSYTFCSYLFFAYPFLVFKVFVCGSLLKTSVFKGALSFRNHTLISHFYQPWVCFLTISLQVTAHQICYLPSSFVYRLLPIFSSTLLISISTLTSSSYFSALSTLIEVFVRLNTHLFKKKNISRYELASDALVLWAGDQALRAQDIPIVGWIAVTNSYKCYCKM